MIFGDGDEDEGMEQEEEEYVDVRNMSFKNEQKRIKKMNRDSRIYGIFDEDDEEDGQKRGGKFSSKNLGEVFDSDDEEEDGRPQMRGYLNSSNNHSNNYNKYNRNNAQQSYPEEVEQKHRLVYGNFRSSGILRQNVDRTKKVIVKRSKNEKKDPLKGLKRKLKDMEDLDDLEDFGDEEIEEEVGQLSDRQKERKRIFENLIKREVIQKEIRHKEVILEQENLKNYEEVLVQRDQSSYEQTREQRKEELEHSKRYGKGLDILKKFGWGGGGLGKNQDGITKPVEAVFKQSLGKDVTFDRSKKPAKKSEKEQNPEEQREEEDEEETQNQINKIQGIWRITEEDQDGSPFTEELPRYHLESSAIQTKLDASVQQLFIIFEKLRAEESQESVKVKTDQDQLLLETFELEQMRENFSIEETESKQYSELLQRVLKLQKEYESLNSQETYECFRGLFDDFKFSFIKVELQHLFTKLYQEKFRENFESWSPSQKTEGLFEQFKLATGLVREVLAEKEKLEYSKYETRIKHMQETEQITLTIDKDLSEESQRFIKRFKDYVVQKGIMPQLRAYILSVWQPESLETDQLIDFLDLWNEFIHEQISEQIMKQLILPKLQRSIEEYEFRFEESSITSLHLWLHPWLKIQGTNFDEELWGLVQRKFTQLFLSEEILNESIYDQFKPWTRIFSEKQNQIILTRCILPKLMHLVSGIYINPANQDLEELEKLTLVNKWVTLINDNELIDILYEDIFDNLSKILDLWLQNPEHDKNEIKEWVSGWISEFPPKVNFACQSKISSLKKKI